MKRLKLILVLLIALGGAGCTPEYNWRELSVADERAVVLFPSRAKTEQRTLKVEGVELNFSLTSAAVDQAVFAVGYAPVSVTAESSQGRALVRAFVAALATRVGHDVPEQALAGDVFEIETTVAGQASRLMGRVLIYRGMLIQAVVSGPKKTLSRENAVEFMRSLVLR